MNEDLLSRLLEEMRGLRADIRCLAGGALDKEAAAQFLGISTRTLDKLIAAGKLTPVDNSIEEGKRCRVTLTRQELERYLRDNSRAGWPN